MLYLAVSQQTLSPYLSYSMEQFILKMEPASDISQRKEIEKVSNGAEFDILHKDVAFWQRAVECLSQVEQISEDIDESAENVSK